MKFPFLMMFLLSDLALGESHKGIESRTPAQDGRATFLGKVNVSFRWVDNPNGATGAYQVVDWDNNIVCYGVGSGFSCIKVDQVKSK